MNRLTGRAAQIEEVEDLPEISTIFPEDWSNLLPALAAQYREAKPVPHIYLEGLVDEAAALAASAEFPSPSTAEWTHYQHQNENKHGMAKRQLFPSAIGEVSDALNSKPFLRWLSVLTGIPGLIADLTLEGGGLHQSGRGGFLNVHTDFSHHHYHTNWKRRVNLILYLNPAWEDAWGGSLELWDNRMRHCVAKYPPMLNSAVIFNTDENSYHGFPDPLACPPGVSRQSLAFYYYTLDDGARIASRSTNYRARPTDGVAKSVMIWFDKQAVNLYSRAKARFGFSDEFASRILKKFSRRK
jgi:hypothetical protein